jgi:hypothetical protein
MQSSLTRSKVRSRRSDYKLAELQSTQQFTFPQSLYLTFEGLGAELVELLGLSVVQLFERDLVMSLLHFIVTMLLTMTGHSQVPAHIVNDLGAEVQPSACQAERLNWAMTRVPRDSSIHAAWFNMPDAGMAYTSDRVIALDAAAECAYVPSNFWHEWTHIRQADYFGDYSKAITALGSPALERIADCASQKLSVELHVAHYEPYLVNGKCAHVDRINANRIVKGNR